MPDRYWHAGTLHMGPPGLQILQPQDIEVADEWGRIQKDKTIKAPEGFQTYASNSLNLLYCTETGKLVIDALVRAANCKISFSPGNSAGVGNAQASMNKTAFEIIKRQGPAGQTQNALRKCYNASSARYNAKHFSKGKVVEDKYSWLAGRINAQPYWRLDHEPGAYGGTGSMLQSVRSYLFRGKDETEGYFDEQLYVKTLGVSSAGLNTTKDEVKKWIEQKKIPTRLGSTDKTQFQLATIVALEEFSTPGDGSPSSIRFATGDADKMKDLRPPAIALGHELIHGYWSLKGKQPGEELSHYSTVLFEYKCVGLGPWNEHGLSENGLRKDWGKVALSAFDAPNRKAPGKRIRY